MHLGKPVDIGIDISLGEGSLHRTKIVRFSVRLVFINRLSRPLKIKQGNNLLGIVQPDETKRLSCVKEEKDRAIRVSYEEDNANRHIQWSGEIDANSVGVYILKMYCQESSEERNRVENSELKFSVIAADIRLYSPTMFACFRHVDESAAFYRIENNLATHDLLYRQENCDNTSWQVLEAGTSALFAWDEPLFPHNVSNNVIQSIH